MNATQKVRTLIHPIVKVLDAAKGLVEYRASDASIDSYREVIRAAGWKFDMFEKNSPLVDSHNYDGIDNLLGKVADFYVKDGELINVGQFAIDVPENTKAMFAWKMVSGGYLPAVSVGFMPTKSVSRYGMEPKAWSSMCEENGLKGKQDVVERIYQEQQQVELSVCILGANPNALAKAHKDGALSTEDMSAIGFRTDDDLAVLEKLALPYDTGTPEQKALTHIIMRAICGGSLQSKTISQKLDQQSATAADAPDGAALAKRQELDRNFLAEIQRLTARPVRR